MDALHLNDILEGGIWETDGRSFTEGTLLAVVRPCSQCHGLGWLSSHMECDCCVGMGEHLDHLAEVAVYRDGFHQLSKTHPNEVHPFFMGYLTANPMLRVGQSAHNAVDIFFPGLLRALPESMDIFQVEEADDDRYVAFWTWVAEKTQDGCPVSAVARGEGLKVQW